MKKTPTEVKMSIPAMNIGRMSVTIKGTTPLIFHRWSEKAKKMMLDKQMKKAQKGREIRNPNQEYKESYYKDADKDIAFPALAIKQSIVNSARNLNDVKMTLLRGAIFIVGDKDGLIKVKYESEEMREDMVRVGMGTADLRFRGQVNNWSMTFMVEFNADVVSAEQIINLLQVAGFACGLGEWRPEKNGDYGRFVPELVTQ